MIEMKRSLLLPATLIVFSASNAVFAKDVFLACKDNRGYEEKEIIMAFNESEGWIKRYFEDTNELVDLLSCSNYGISCSFSSDSNQIRYEATVSEDSSGGFVGTDSVVLSRRTGLITRHHDGVNDYGRKNETVMNATCRATNDPREAPALF